MTDAINYIFDEITFSLTGDELSFVADEDEASVDDIEAAEAVCAAYDGSNIARMVLAHVDYSMTVGDVVRLLEVIDSDLDREIAGDHYGLVETAVDFLDADELDTLGSGRNIRFIESLLPEGVTADFDTDHGVFLDDHFALNMSAEQAESLQATVDQELPAGYSVDIDETGTARFDWLFCSETPAGSTDPVSDTLKNLLRAWAA